MLEALLGFVAMFALMALRVPIALSMGAIGFVGIGLMRSWPAAVSNTANEFTDVASYYAVGGAAVHPDGQLRRPAPACRSELYRAGHAFIGHLRGGLAMATIAACAGFGAICGSSIATAATMARVVDARDAPLRLRRRASPPARSPPAARSAS